MPEVNSQRVRELYCTPRAPGTASEGKPGLFPRGRVPSYKPRFLKRRQLCLSLGDVLGLLFQVGKKGVGNRKQECLPPSFHNQSTWAPALGPPLAG